MTGEKWGVRQRLYRQTSCSVLSSRCRDETAGAKAMSFQIAILKILSSRPDGRAGLAELKADLAILSTSGREWTDRMKRLAACAPRLDIFSRKYVLREATHWQITIVGRDFLASIEGAQAAKRDVESSVNIVSLIERRGNEIQPSITKNLTALRPIQPRGRWA